MLLVTNGLYIYLRSIVIDLKLKSIAQIVLMNKMDPLKMTVLFWFYQ